MQKVSSNIDEVIAGLKLHKERILAEGRFTDALLAALNTGMGLMKRRIFNLGEDAEGNSLGIYKSPRYIAIREKAGRQVENKDEEFTGSLRRSIEVVVIDNKIVSIQIINAENAAIAGFQEEQLNTVIFSLSKEEFSTVEKQALILIKQIIDEL